MKPKLILVTILNILLLQHLLLLKAVHKLRGKIKLEINFPKYVKTNNLEVNV